MIKNVAGYDIAKLFTGSFGTLGAILEVVVRLHPLDPQTATARGRTDDPDALAAAASALAHARMETVSLDVAWGAGAGTVLARFGGRSAHDQAEAAVALLGDRGGVEADVLEDDAAAWEAQRAGQRAVEDGGVVVRVSGVQAELAARAAGRRGSRCDRGGPRRARHLVAPPAGVRAPPTPWPRSGALRRELGAGAVRGAGRAGRGPLRAGPLG